MFLSEKTSLLSEKALFLLKNGKIIKNCNINQNIDKFFGIGFHFNLRM